MLQQRWTWRAGRETIHIRVASQGAGSVAAEARAALEVAIQAVEKAGFSRGQITRSRLWAADAKARTEASDVRRDFLSGDLRSASASFWGAEILPDGARVMIDVEALRPLSNATKTVVEYSPVITPPAFVTLDGMVSLSGNTDESDGLEAQVAAIAEKIRASLAKAGASPAKIVTLSAYLSASQNPATAHALIRRALPEADCPLVISTVHGFSAAKKLVEIEVDAEI
jgi:enamine deaminase RidA (YjgF/YER057c/UK114 family)